MIRVCLPCGTNYGWGVCGNNLLKELSTLTEIGQVTDPKLPLLMAVTGPTFQPLRYVPRGVNDCGFAFIESPSIAAASIAQYKLYYHRLICGSTWMADRMKEIGVEKTHVVLQGLDYELFNTDPIPGVGVELDPPFTVFIGGKAEYRKGTDIAIAALKIFLDSHKDARAILATMNLWPQTMHSLSQSKWIKYIPVNDDWRIQMTAVMTANGLPMDRISLPKLANNTEMKGLYQMADVGLFPNRCEAGNNMVMCEAIACGMPVIASFATGHTDVLRGLAGAQSLCNGKTSGPDGWWEPHSIDELIAHLEHAYDNRDQTRENGRVASRSITNILGDWRWTAARTLEILEGKK